MKKATQQAHLRRQRFSVVMLVTIGALSLACAMQRTGAASYIRRSPTIVGVERVAFSGTIGAIRSRSAVPSRWNSRGEDHWTVRASEPHDALVRLSVRDGALVIRWQHADDVPDEVRTQLHRFVRAVIVVAAAQQAVATTAPPPEPPVPVVPAQAPQTTNTDRSRRRSPQ
ncbi:MAG: hypothetical protein JNK05_12365 [Myxococcales bacterium]|nr:hypothetical protein [Myxococcales bacterium]